MSAPPTAQPNDPIGLASARQAGATHLASLTSIRFFAAAWVVLFHYGVFHLLPPIGFLYRLGTSGHLGVSAFFVLSGFILSFTYAGRLDSGRFEMRGFLLARFARVYPLYFACLVLGGVQQWLFLGPDDNPGLFTHPLRSIVENVFLIQNWDPIARGAINGPGWSIACEAAFYLAFPLLFVMIARVRIECQLFLAIGLVAIGWIIETAFTNAGLRLFGGGLKPAEYTKLTAQLCAWLPFARFDEFALGIVAFRLAHATRDRLRVSKILAVGSLLLAVVIGLHMITRRVPGHLYSPHYPEAILPVVFAGGILWLARQKGERPRFLAHPVLVLGGKISFALYLVHLPILFVAMGLKKSYPSLGPLAIGLSPFVSLALAYAAYRFIEEPMRALILHRKRDLAPFPAAP